MADFTWTPARGFTTEVTPRVSVASFGDGYSQRVASGINNIQQTWNLQFTNNSIAIIDSIDAFLTSKGGVLSFTWVPPGEFVEVKVVCYKWQKTYESSISKSLSATFEKVYE